jgi:hypothetical protein
MAGAGLVRASYFDVLDDELPGAAGGELPSVQQVRAGALDLGGEGRRVLVRLLGFEVDEEASPLAAGGSGRSYGVFGRLIAGAGVTLVVESARGEYTPLPGAFEEPTEAEAFRLGLAQHRGSLDWQLEARHVGEGYVNALARGTTSSGRGGRDGLKLTLNKGFGPSTLNVVLEGLEGSEGAAPPARVGSAQLAFFRPLGEGGQLALNGSLVSTRAAADPALFAPEADRLDWSLGASLSVLVGALQLSPTLSFARHQDRIEPLSDSDTKNAGLSATAQVRGVLSLSGSINGTRSEGDPTFGRTDSLVASLQPSWQLRRVHLTLAPYYSWNRTANEVLGPASVSDLIHLGVSWSPPWWRSLLSVDLGGDWSRTRSGQPGDGDFLARYTASLVLRGGARADPGTSGGTTTTVRLPLTRAQLAAAWDLAALPVARR